MRNAAESVLTRILVDPPRKFRTVTITNAAVDTYDVVERVTEAGASTEQTRPLALAFPAGIFSLSHVALPFPMSDSLYGMQPDKTDEFFGVHLGSIAPRGERGVLILEPRHAASRVVEPVLPLSSRAHRAKHRRPSLAAILQPILDVEPQDGDPAEGDQRSSERHPHCPEHRPEDHDGEQSPGRCHIHGALLDQRGYHEAFDGLDREVDDHDPGERR